MSGESRSLSHAAQCGLHPGSRGTAKTPSRVAAAGCAHKQSLVFTGFLPLLGILRGLGASAGARGDAGGQSGSGLLLQGTGNHRPGSRMIPLDPEAMWEQVGLWAPAWLG